MSIFPGSTAPAVGLTETNDLSSALRSLGMKVIVGDDLNQSARLIKDAVAEGISFPIISFEDKVGIGKKSFISRYARTGHRVVIVSSDPRSIIDSPESTYVPTPARLGDILVAAGFDVDANDPRLSATVDDSYRVGSGAPAAVSAPQSNDPFDGVPAPAVAVPREERPAPTSRREAREAAPSTDSELDDLFDGVPEASVDAVGEPVAREHEPEPVAAPSVPDFLQSDEPDWMSAAPAQTTAPDPVAEVAPVEDETPDWMTPAVPAQTTALATEADDETPDWALPVPAAGHRNQDGNDWLGSVVPEGDEYTPAGRGAEDEAVEEPAHVEPVFDDAPLDASFDPDWEPEEEDAPSVDLNEPTSFIPAPTSPVIARPPVQSEDPKWMQDAMNSIPDPEPVVEEEPDDFEIIAPVFATAPSVTPVVEEEPDDFDTMMNQMLDQAIPAPVQEAPPATPVPKPIPTFDPNNSSMWATEPAPATAPETFRAAPVKEKLCPIIVSMASKGGVGKTSIATALAWLAASHGLRVTLIDGNRGQGGIRKFARVNERIVSVYDAAVHRDPKVAIAYPKEINAARDPNLPPISFAMVLAPPDALANPQVVTAQVYADVVRYARSVSDIVILDTQISERFDTTGIIESVAIPSIASEGGFGLGITDGSSEGVRNLAERLEHFSSIGIGREHLLSIVNKMGYFDDSIVAAMRNNYDPYSQFIGVVGMDTDFQDKHNVGIIDATTSSLAPALSNILLKATGDSRFAPAPVEKQTRRGLFGKR